jgi:hypothetical protein
MIDAEVRSEERFSRLALAYEGEVEKKSVCDCIENLTEKHKLIPTETYTTKVSNGKEVIVIEFHDDCNRETGELFEAIIKDLDIKICH